MCLWLMIIVVCVCRLGEGLCVVWAYIMCVDIRGDELERCFLVGLRNMFSTVIICITDFLFRLKKIQYVCLLLSVKMLLTFLCCSFYI